MEECNEKKKKKRKKDNRYMRVLAKSFPCAVRKWMKKKRRLSYIRVKSWDWEPVVAEACAEKEKYKVSNKVLPSYSTCVDGKEKAFEVY